MRSAVIEIGGTTTRAVVAEPTPAGRLAIRLDRRIVLRLGRAVEREGAIGEGLRLLVVETVRRLQAECFRAGVGRACVAVTAELAAASDLGGLLGAVQRRCGEAAAVRSLDDEAGLLLEQVGIAGDLALADVDERAVRVVDRIGGRVEVRRSTGPLAPVRQEPRVGASHGEPAIAPVAPVEPVTAVVTGPITATVCWRFPPRWPSSSCAERSPGRPGLGRDRVSRISSSPTRSGAASRTGAAR